MANGHEPHGGNRAARCACYKCLRPAFGARVSSNMVLTCQLVISICIKPDNSIQVWVLFYVGSSFMSQLVPVFFALQLSSLQQHLSPAHR
jgi:hypothetical protein